MCLKMVRVIMLRIKKRIKSLLLLSVLCTSQVSLSLELSKKQAEGLSVGAGVAVALSKLSYDYFYAKRNISGTRIFVGAGYGLLTGFIAYTCLWHMTPAGRIYWIKKNVSRSVEKALNS